MTRHIGPIGASWLRRLVVGSLLGAVLWAPCSSEAQQQAAAPAAGGADIWRGGAPRQRLGGCTSGGETTTVEHAFAIYRLTHGPEGPGQLLAALRLTAAAANHEHGCRGARVYQQADDSGGVLLVEEWETPGDLERHMRTPMFRRVLETLELSQTAPEVVYLEGSRLRGMEWIAEVLGDRSES